MSEKHANFIVNDRKGTAADVRRLMDRVRATVFEANGVTLEPEIVFAGDWAGWPWPADATAEPAEAAEPAAAPAPAPAPDAAGGGEP